MPDGSQHRSMNGRRVNTSTSTSVSGSEGAPSMHTREGMQGKTPNGGGDAVVVRNGGTQQLLTLRPEGDKAHRSDGAET